MSSFESGAKVSADHPLHQTRDLALLASPVGKIEMPKSDLILNWSRRRLGQDFGDMGALAGNYDHNTAYMTSAIVKPLWFRGPFDVRKFEIGLIAERSCDYADFEQTARITPAHSSPLQKGTRRGKTDGKYNQTRLPRFTSRTSERGPSAGLSMKSFRGASGLRLSKS
jgi:hypothetical protein